MDQGFRVVATCRSIQMGWMSASWGGRGEKERVPGEGGGIGGKRHT
jgi:hypothetical protein